MAGLKKEQFILEGLLCHILSSSALYISRIQHHFLFVAAMCFELKLCSLSSIFQS